MGYSISGVTGFPTRYFYKRHNHLRTLGYVNEVEDMETKETKEFLNEECHIMEGEKYYLIVKWIRSRER
jgi:hypothetical protein